MRSDIHKVLFIKTNPQKDPNRNGTAKKLDIRQDWESLEVDWSKPDKRTPHHYKESARYYTPLNRWLNKQPGKPWAEVWAEVCEHNKGNKFTKLEVRRAVRQQVHIGEVSLYGYGKWVGDDGVLVEPPCPWKRQKPKDHPQALIVKIPITLDTAYEKLEFVKQHPICKCIQYSRLPSEDERRGMYDPSMWMCHHGNKISWEYRWFKVQRGPVFFIQNNPWKLVKGPILMKKSCNKKDLKIIRETIK